MTNPSDFEPEPMAPALLVGCLISIALIIGGVAWFQWGPGSIDGWSDEEGAHIRSGTSFPPLTVDERRLQRDRDDFYTEPDLTLIEDEVDVLLDTFREANLAQFPAHGPEEELSAEQHVARVTFLANDVLVVAGVRGFQSVGAPVLDACRAGLEDILSAIQSGNLPLSQAAEDPPADRFAQYRENCGNLLPFLIERNLVTSDGEWTHDDTPTLVDILQRYRWADLIGGQFPVHYQLAPYELELFYRWRIEDSEAFTLSQRHQFLEQAKAFLPSDYDFSLAQTRLDAASRDADEALQLFEELAEENPDNEFYQALYEEIQRQQRIGES